MNVQRSGFAPGNGLLDDPALAALMEWRASPAIHARAGMIFSAASTSLVRPSAVTSRSIMLANMMP
ncbi:hypothetical protein L6Q21_08070 [Sandaracinobacter sp. RS1-74]|uniref:hypothetical protein n=1 Tax=Sandaracinobacteroides sayramensis TaxID=2913411 RepID=UPI001EDABB71|nr:hypothetical protein [Sandaracinobacteroides sayramensis]MCG2840935.1 hypothetical protein [Sandaracinobacteroides sayramensis]